MKYLFVLLAMFGVGYGLKAHVAKLSQKRQDLVLELNQDRKVLIDEEQELDWMVKHKDSPDMIGMEKEILNSKRFIFFMSKFELNDFDNSPEGKLLLMYRRFF